MNAILLSKCVKIMFFFSAALGHMPNADAEPIGPIIRQVQVADENISCAVYAPAPVPESMAGLVIHLYGSGGSHRPNEFNVGRPPFEQFRRLLAARGYWLVVPDLGPASWMNDKACRQLDAVIADMVHHEEIAPSRIHLLGTSMGGGSSLIYMMRRPDTVKSLVAIFPMTDFVQWLSEAPKYRELIEKAHAIPAMQRDSALRAISPMYHPEAFMKSPIFLLHGDQDTIVPVHHSLDFAAELQRKGCNVTLHVVLGETHRDEIVEPFQQMLADFITNTE